VRQVGEEKVHLHMTSMDANGLESGSGRSAAIGASSDSGSSSCSDSGLSVEANRVQRLRGRRIIVGICGGIACYKVASVVSALTQAGVETTVVMTDAATRFVTPLTFQALSGRPVQTSVWEQVDASDPQHIRAASRADAMLIAPCTLDALARLAHGHADDIVSLIVSAIDRSRCPVLLAPSMNAQMWRQPATQRNLGILLDDGFTVVEPREGWQACRTVGVGRLPEPDELVDALLDALPDMQPAIQPAIQPDIQPDAAPR